MSQLKSTYNDKAVLDTNKCCSYGECTYAEIAEKLEKISHNYKAWSTRKSAFGWKTIVVQATYNTTIDENREKIAHMSTKLGLVLKYVSGGTDKMNVVNYFAKPPPPVNEYYVL